MSAQSLLYTRAVPEVQGDEISTFGSDRRGGFFCGKFSVKLSQENSLELGTENFTTFFTPRKTLVTCNSLWEHPRLTFSSKDSIAFNRLRGRQSARVALKISMLAQSLFYTRAVPEIQIDEILKFWE